jgi:hypothetical protein
MTHMEEDAKEWYYTSGPDQAGPVTFEELKAMATAAGLHPRQDMVWKESMDEWIPAGQIDGLFEKRSADVTAEAAAISMTGLESHKPHQIEEVELWPGASRRWFFLLVLLFPFLWVVLCMTFTTFVGHKLSPGFEKLFLLIGIIVPVWVVLDTSLSRLSNLGMSKLWFFVHFIPVANLWLAYRSLACPAGYAKNKKLDPPGWVLAILYWLSIVSLIAMAFTISAMLATAWKDSEFMEKFESLRGQVESVTDDKAKESKESNKSVKPAP